VDEKTGIQAALNVTDGIVRLPTRRLLRRESLRPVNTSHQVVFEMGQVQVNVRRV
jgi:hypothetical protein